MLAAPDKTLCLALALTAVLAVKQGQDPLWLWDRAHRAAAKPLRWLPLAVLLVLALASSVFGILHPQEFAAMSDGGVLDPEMLAVARGP